MIFVNILISKNKIDFLNNLKLSIKDNQNLKSILFNFNNSPAWESKLH